jgi:hypothetical protein
MDWKYLPQLPNDYGQYWFLLTNGQKVWGYYSSFPYPHDEQIRIANLEYCYFYYLDYSQIRGYFQFLNEPG